ncbi:MULTISPECIES: hypothetical protein [unclassified Sphingobacterium]|uniref:hypothetical protein n=1 Tax=unclassified Sphingobacterium TaxID=2609468 RepID=UPI0025E6450E|nr:MULTISPECIES: hypothetical protein [unclassified Sphingobacterium]
MERLTKVTLVCKDLGERLFTIDHAQSLLDLENRKGWKNWELLPNKGFELQDGVIKRANKATNKSSGKRTQTS